MKVEACCQALLAKIIPEVAPSRSGFTIDIGIGTSVFYFELFDKLGFKSVAVEPLPTKQLIQLCQYRNIPLVEACISTQDGMTDLYIGSYQGNQDFNLNSTRPNWWGATSIAKKVQSITLKTLINQLAIDEVTCLKVDVEGSEYSILKQFSSLEKKLHPKVLMFEYGGGNTYGSREAGWSREFLEATLSIFKLLQCLNYQLLIKIDSEDGSRETIFDLKDLQIEAGSIFSFKNLYGNIIALHENIDYSKSMIHDICKTYRDHGDQTPPLKISEPLSRRVSRKMRQIFSR
jgi:FkbM family methyltransferase